MSNVSFERTDAERTLAHRLDRWRRFGHRRRGKRIRNRRLVFNKLFCDRLGRGYVLQKKCGRYEEQISGHGAAEVEQPIVVSGWPADEHVLEHLLDGAGRTAVADEIGSEFTVGWPAERHIVAQDLDFFPVLDDGRERTVRGSWLDGVVQFDVGQLGAANDSFLRLRGERIPCAHIVEVFLHDDVAAGGERGVLLADKHSIDGCSPWILRPIDKAEQVALIEVAKTLDFVHRRNSISQTRHKLSGKLEA